MIAASRAEKELSILLCNTIQELPVTLEDIWKKKEKKKKKKKENSQLRKNSQKKKKKKKEKKKKPGMADWKKNDHEYYLIQSVIKYYYMQIEW